MSNIITSANFKLEIIKGFHPQFIQSSEPNRNIHEVARVTTSFRTFVVLQDFNNRQDVWLNEWLGSSIEEIKDDALFHDLYAFLFEKGVVTINANQDTEAEKQGGVR